MSQDVYCYGYVVPLLVPVSEDERIRLNGIFNDMEPDPGIRINYEGTLAYVEYTRELYDYGIVFASPYQSPYWSSNPLIIRSQDLYWNQLVPYSCIYYDENNSSLSELPHWLFKPLIDQSQDVSWPQLVSYSCIYCNGNDSPLNELTIDDFLKKTTFT